jgi:hypothetical protein
MARHGSSRKPESPIKRRQRLHKLALIKSPSPHSPRRNNYLRSQQRATTPESPIRPKKGIWDTPTKQRVITLREQGNGPTKIAQKIAKRCTPQSVSMILKRSNGSTATRRQTSQRGAKKRFNRSHIITMIDFLSRN